MSFVVLSIAGVAVGVAGTGLAAYGQYQAGQAQKEMANYNAKLAENEAIAKEQATAAETQRIRSQKERALASQRAGYAKGGAVITEGTPLLTMAEQAGLMELDILQMQRTGAMSARASTSEAALSRYSGEQAATGAMRQVGGTLLAGAGSAASTYGSMSKAPSGGGGQMTMTSDAPASVKAKYGWA